MDTELIINEEIGSYLKETSRWGRFLAIVGFIFIGLMLLGGSTLMGTGGGDFEGIGTAFSGQLFGIFYLILAIVYFFPTWYLFKYATKVKLAIDQNVQEELQEAFKNLRRLFLFFGVITAVSIIFYVLAIIAIVTGGIIGETMQV